MAVALRSERRAFLWRVRVEAKPVESGKQVTLDEVIGILEGEYTAGRARVYLDAEGRIIEDATKTNPKSQLYIADIQRDPKRKIVSLLINRGDPTWVDPALLDASANQVRFERPTAKEAPGWSAHLVLSTDPERNSHRACFEQMQRIPGTLVLDAFDAIVAQALLNNPTYKYEKVVRKKKGKPTIEHKPYRPQLNISRAPSERLSEDLNEGYISGITLTRHKAEFAGVSEDRRIKSVEQKIVINLHRLEAGRAEQYVQNLIPKVKGQFNEMQVHIGGLPGNQSSNPNFSLDDDAALEHLYVRAKRLTNFTGFLEQCYEKVCPGIVDKMHHELTDPANWPRP